MTSEQRQRLEEIRATGIVGQSMERETFLLSVIDGQAKEIDLFKVYGEKMHRNYEDAEKERDRMKEALEKIAKVYYGRDYFIEHIKIAREALK